MRNLPNMSCNSFSVTAIVTIRNGAFYFRQLCEHARNNGILLAVIDNDSVDDLQELIQQNSDIIVNSSSLPFDGTFNLTRQLQVKQEIASNLDTDWLIHLDADELLFSDKPGETLHAAIKRVDELGYNAINFDEFVFLPADLFKDYSKRNYHKMRWYYFFEPHPIRLIRAYQSSLKTQLQSGGHQVEGERNLYPHNMILRHYMFQNKSHLKIKYKDRSYSSTDIQSKFHGNRIPLQNRQLTLPKRKHLLRAGKLQWNLNRNDPKQKHFWQW